MAKNVSDIIRKAVRESVEEELHPSYPVNPNISNPGDSLPLPKQNKGWDKLMNPKDLQTRLKRSIFNIMSQYEGQHQDYSMEDISKDLSERYSIPYDTVYEIAIKCLRSKMAMGEAEWCVTELPPTMKKYPEILQPVAESIRLTESQIRNIVSEAVRRIVEDRWAQDYQNMLDADAYDKYLGQNLLKRGIDIVTGNRPNKPAGYKKNEPMDDRASRYVQAFNNEKGTGRRMDFPDGSSSHVGMKYTDNFEPMLSHFEYDGSTGYGERNYFGPNGLERTEGPKYPESEFSVRGRYKNSDNPDIDRNLNRFDSLSREIADVTKNARRPKK